MEWPEAERLVEALGPKGRDVLLRTLTTTEEIDLLPFEEVGPAPSVVGRATRATGDRLAGA
jgi:hypothetical protein